MRLHHVDGDEIVFLYDHTQRPQPRVGDSYYVQEVGSDEALVVQIVALETFDYPSLSEVLMRQLMEEAYGADRVRTFADSSNAPQVDNLGQARGKIRRRRSGDDEWRIWNGWLPSRNVQISRVDDEELLANCGLQSPRHPLTLGTTLDGRKFAIAGRNFEKINVITALKGMGKSYLAKVIIIELIRRGMPSVVFDLNHEYDQLPSLRADGEGQVIRQGAIVLSASRNFRVTIESFGRSGLIRLFEHYNPTENMRNTFELRVNQAFDKLETLDDANRRVQIGGRLQPRPFFNLDYIRSLFPQPPKTHEAVFGAIMDRIEQIEALNLFAETKAQGLSFFEQYDLCAQKGGVLVVDLASLTSAFARETFVTATLDMVERVATTSSKLPFVFFEEAHLYASGTRIQNLVTRARHLGITSTFVTNMVTQLDETVLRQVAIFSCSTYRIRMTCGMCLRARQQMRKLCRRLRRGLSGITRWLLVWQQRTTQLYFGLRLPRDLRWQARPDMPFRNERTCP